MTRYFFDLHATGQITIDDDGVDLVHEGLAKSLALETLGQLITDGATGPMSVEVRVAAGPVLRISTAVVVEKL